MTWVEDQVRAREAGYSWDEINAFRTRRRDRAIAEGYDEQTINSYFGRSDPAPLNAQIRARIEAANAERTQADPTIADGAGGPTPAQGQDDLDTVYEAWTNGLQLGASGLMIRSRLPDQIAPEHMGRAMRLAQYAGVLVSDLPAIITGAVIGSFGGGAAGTAVAPGPGTATGLVVGGGAGAFALPTLIREEYIDALQNGWADGPQDFLARQGAIAWETAKAAIVGAVTAPAGPFARAALVTRGVTRIPAATAALGAEITVLTTASAALEGELPTAEHFLDAAILLTGFKGAARLTSIPRGVRDVQARLQEHWARTGEKPIDAAARAQKDPAFREELQTRDPEKAETGKVGEDLETRTASEVLTELTRKPDPIEATKPVAGPARAEQALLDRIGRDNASAFSFGREATRFMVEMVDSTHPIKRFILAAREGKEITPEQLNAVELLTLTNGSAGKSEYNVRIKMTDINGKVVGRSLEEIIGRHKGKNRDSFKAYSIARWALEKASQRKETGVGMRDAQTVVKAGRARFEKDFQELNTFQNTLLRLLVDSGLMAKSKFTSIVNKVKAYIPAYRISEGFNQKKGAGAGKVSYDPIRAFEGSESKIADPFESMVKNIFLFRELADRNRANLAMVDVAAKHGLAAKNTKVSATKLDAKEIEKIAKELGLEKEDIPEGIDINIFRPSRHRLAADEIIVYREGKAEVWKLGDPEVAKILKGLDQQTLGIIDRILKQMVRVQRTFITLAPSFAVRQMFMDTGWSFITSPGLRNSAGEFVFGLGGIMRIGGKETRASKAYDEFMRAGGANSSIRQVEKEYIQSGILRNWDRTGFLGGVRNLASSPYRLLKLIANVQADASRIGRIRSGRARGESLQTASVAARETTLDFSVQGTVGRRMNAGIAFFGPYMNGMARSAAAQFGKGLKVGLQTSAKAAAVITIPMLTNWWFYKDEKWYQDLPNWKKDLGLVYRSGGNGPDGITWFVPFPPVFGLLYGGMPRRILEHFIQKNPHAAEGFAASIGMSLFPPGLTYSTLTPFVEHMSNWSFFRGTPLESDRLRDGVLAPERYSNYSTETARNIAVFLEDVPLVRNFELSPPVIENYIRGWSGTLGAAALVASDVGLEVAGRSEIVRPTRTLADIPFLQSFVVRYPSANTQGIRRYYDRVNRMEQVRGSMNRSLDSFNIDRFQDLIDKNPGAFVKLQGIEDAMANSRQLVNNVYANPAMSPDDKRQLLDQTYGLMIIFSGAGNDVLDDMGID